MMTLSFLGIEKKIKVAEAIFLPSENIRFLRNLTKIYWALIIAVYGCVLREEALKIFELR